MALTGTKALEAWARRVTSGYNNVNILNMTTSWRNGLGFCAIIHHFHPHLIDFESLDPDDVLGNNSLAFTVAEQQLGIPSLLDPRDMAECELLDRLSILTYLAQYHQVLTSPAPLKLALSAPVSASPSGSPVKVAAEPGAGGPRGEQGERCQLCARPVFILERLQVAGKLFHRTCFKCARCNEQLTLASFYETETGQFCCEVCPDEEDNERKRTLRARKDLAKLMADDEDDKDDDGDADADEGDEDENTEEDNESKCDAASHTSNISVNASKAEPEIVIEEQNTEGDVDQNVDSPMPKSETPDNIELDVHQDNVLEVEPENFKSRDSNSVDNNENVVVAQLETKADLCKQESYPEDINPFGDDNEECEQIQVDITVTEDKEESANPFGSDFDSDDEKENTSTSNLHSQVSSSTNFSQNPFGEDFSSEEDSNTIASQSPSVSSKSVHRRKKKKAPPPPTPTKTVTPVPAPRRFPVEDVKSRKDADNINRKNELLSRTEVPPPAELGHVPQDKAEEGQWRRKKGPAPPRPLPPKRAVKKLPRKAINQELFDIEVKQVGLERQGVKLEKSIREICANNDSKEGADRDSLGPEAEDLIIQLFDLVNEKNELFRRQTELIYMKKENRLEEIHADLEYQIRCLMAKPECQRTDDDKVAEEKLIAKLVEVVSQRNVIVDCLEMERQRELDEDTAIEDHMQQIAAVKPEEKHQIALVKLLKRKKKKKKNRDDEKDVDTSELKVQEEKQTKKEKSAKKKILSMTTKKLNSLNISLKKQ